MVSSDHAPYAYDATGKLMAGSNPTFKQIANGLPGLEVRMPLLFDMMVSKGRLGLSKFVELTATAPAKIYNLHPRKGSIAIGADADLALWNPDVEITLSDRMMHDRAGYTPFAGRKLQGWPTTVLSRGRVIVADGKRSVEAGTGRFLPRSGGEAAKGLEELADLDQGATWDFPIQGYAVTADWAKKYPNTLKAFTTALSQGQEIADTDRAAVENVIGKYLHIDKQSAEFISLPAFPLGVDAVRLQRVVSSMKRFGLLPRSTNFQITSMITG